MNKKTIKDINLKNKKVIMRVDFNVPIKAGKISDNARITAALPSIKYILEQNASLIIMSHLGRPDGAPNPEYSLKPAADELSKLLGQKIIMAQDCIGPEVKKMAAALKPKEILMLENVRFHKQEDDKKDKDGRKAFAKELASLAEIYVNDAFGTAHREHASTANIASFLPAVAGFLMEKELNFLGNAIDNPKRPLIAILGGAKISDKIPVIENLLAKADKVIIGGGMAFTFFKAMGYEIGKSLLDAELIGKTREFLEKGKDKIILPVDTKVTAGFNFSEMKLTGELKTVPSSAIPADQEGIDIGEESVKKFSEIIKNAKTVLWNGPMGVFECPDTAKGTFAVAEALASATKSGALTIIGGGDSASAIKKAKLLDQVTHVSTGGGASLEYLEGKILPGVAALNDK